jgi:glycerophosphoryl diester phosphodiesterase
MPKPNDTLPRSDIQQQVDRRRRCYQEALVRRLYVKVPDFEFKAGWVDDKNQPTDKKKPYSEDLGVALSVADLSGYNTFQFLDLLKGMAGKSRYSTCDVLGYKPPAPVPCDKLDQHPVVPGLSENDPYQGIARLDLAAADPTRQRELFGWTTPDPGNLVAVAAFEEAKTAYWAGVCKSALNHLEIFRETADFKAADLLRLLYLAGETPLHLRTGALRWRASGSLERDINFSAQIEEHIEKALLEFKFWVDDPFFVDGSFNPLDNDRIRALRKARGENEGDLDFEMTFWSENHQVLFESSEYLAGQWMPEEAFRAGLRYRGEGPAGTRPGDMTGQQRMRHVRTRLIRWLDDRLRLGFSEWNGPGYYQEDFPPLFNLADFCLDEEIRTRARMVLDLLMFDLARFNLLGSFGVTAGRCYAEHKICGYDQSVGDLVEVAFGTRGGVIVDGDSTSAGAFASSRGYDLPDVLVKIGQDRPVHLIDRSRVSLSFSEAPIYGTGFKTLEDAMFWWSRGAYFTKQMLHCTRRIADRYHLSKSDPFGKLLPAFAAIAAAVGAGEAALAIAFPPALLLTGIPGEDESEIADTLSPMTEGSALTRANLYTYRNRDAMLSSAQNWRVGQFNFQSHVCQATLSPGATVWTSHPSSGAYIDLSGAGFIAGEMVGALAGIPLVGGIIGGNLASDPQELWDPKMHDGPNWWTGSVTLPRVVQREGAAILAYQPGEIVRRLFGELTHAWFPRPAFDEGSVFQRSANCNVDDALWTFGKVGNGYVALFSARPVRWTTTGPWANKELLAEAGRNIFIIQVGNQDEFGSYEHFVAKVSHARVHVNGLRWSPSDFECSYDIPSPNGGRLELHHDDDQVRYNGARFSDDFFPRFETPYVKCGRVSWGQYHYTIAFGDHNLTHDFRELRTKVEEAEVHRSVDSIEHDCEDVRFWVVSNRGARSVFPENTLEACRHAVEKEGAMGLFVDACLTADGEIALWHDWDPDEFTATMRQLGRGDVSAYRPAAPDPDDPLRRETIKLSLAQLRFAYGYELTDAASDGEPAPFSIPTLAELVEVARGWAELRHLLINLRMPAHLAAEHGGEMLARILESVGASLPFDLTLIAADEELLEAMRAFTFSAASLEQVEFAWLSLDPGVPSKPDGGPDYAARDAAILEQSAVAGAIRNRTAVAISGRILAADEALYNAYYSFVANDVAQMEPYNLNPRENKGHQIEELLALVKDNPLEMKTLLDLGVSGLITDNVPALLGVLAKAGRI